MYTDSRLWNLCEGLFKLYTTLPPLALTVPDRGLCLQNADCGREGAEGVRLRRDADRAEGHGPEHRLCLQLSGGYLPTLDPPLSTRCSPTLLCSDGQGPHHHGHDRGVPGSGRAGRRRAQPQAHDGGQD